LRGAHGAQHNGAAVREAEARGWFGAIPDYTKRAETIRASSVEIIAIRRSGLAAFPTPISELLLVVMRQAVSLLGPTDAYPTFRIR
jgi:hypothetical protein